MPAAPSVLDRINELHQRYDGPVPPGMIAVARAGSLDALLLIQSEGPAAFYKSMFLGQVRNIKAWREEAKTEPNIARAREIRRYVMDTMLPDLRLYLREWRAWRRRAVRLRRIIAGVPSTSSVSRSFVAMGEKG